MTTPSPSAPLTREELAIARAEVEAIVTAPTRENMTRSEDLLAHYARSLEQHAEAMARAFEFYCGHHESIAAWRAFRPRNPTEGEK